jgi:hypothetical protein
MAVAPGSNVYDLSVKVWTRGFAFATGFVRPASEKLPPFKEVVNPRPFPEFPRQL